MGGNSVPQNEKKGGEQYGISHSSDRAYRPDDLGPLGRQSLRRRVTILSGEAERSPQRLVSRKEINDMWFVFAILAAFVYLCIYLFAHDDRHGPF